MSHDHSVGRQPTVYLIDSDPAVRAETAKLLMDSDLVLEVIDDPLQFVGDLPAGAVGVVITEILFPQLHAIDLLARLANRRPILPVIVLTRHADVASAVEIMRAGAHDFLEKPFAASRLLAAIYRAVEESTARARRWHQGQDLAIRLSQLTRRESEVLSFFLRGLSTKSVAGALDISVKTAEVHRAKVLQKLEAENFVLALRLFHDHDLIPDEVLSNR